MAFVKVEVVGVGMTPVSVVKMLSVKAFKGAGEDIVDPDDFSNLEVDFTAVVDLDTVDTVNCLCNVVDFTDLLDEENGVEVVEE